MGMDGAGVLIGSAAALAAASAGALITLVTAGGQGKRDKTAVIGRKVFTSLKTPAHCYQP